METKEKNTATPYDLDGKPPLKLAIPLGLQHVLAMFVGNLTPLLIITGVCGIESGSALQVALLQNAMLVAGIVTLIQIYTIGPVGGKLPIVMGTSSDLSVSAKAWQLRWEAELPVMEQFWQPALSVVCLKPYLEVS